MKFISPFRGVDSTPVRLVTQPGIKPLGPVIIAPQTDSNPDGAVTRRFRQHFKFLDEATPDSPPLKFGDNVKVVNLRNSLFPKGPVVGLMKQVPISHDHPVIPSD